MPQIYSAPVVTCETNAVKRHVAHTKGRLAHNHKQGRVALVDHACRIYQMSWCDRCDGLHPSKECPHYCWGRGQHEDAQVCVRRWIVPAGHGGGRDRKRPGGRCQLCGIRALGRWDPRAPPSGGVHGNRNRVCAHRACQNLHGLGDKCKVCGCTASWPRGRSHERETVCDSTDCD